MVKDILWDKYGRKKLKKFIIEIKEVFVNILVFCKVYDEK